MTETTLNIEGMMCGMCESHIADTLRKIPGVTRVKADRKKKQAVVVSEDPIDRAVFETAIKPTGYDMTGFASRPYKKKGLFGR